MRKFSFFALFALLASLRLRSKMDPFAHEHEIEFYKAETSTMEWIGIAIESKVRRSTLARPSRKFIASA